MKSYLKKFGVCYIVTHPPISSNKKTNTTAKKDAKKDNTIALKFLMDGLSSSVRESVGEHTSAKDLWFKMESEYKERNQDTKIESEVKSTKEEKHEEKEEHPSDTNEGQNIFYYSSSDCDNAEDDLEEENKYVLAYLLVDIDIIYNLS